MNHLEIDYSHIPCKVKIYNEGVLVKQWNEKQPIDLVHSLIDALDETAFEKMKMKQKISIVTKVFEPKNIRIIDKTKENK